MDPQLEYNSYYHRLFSYTNSPQDLVELLQSVSCTSKIQLSVKLQSSDITFFSHYSIPSFASLQAKDADLGSNLTYRIRADGLDQEIGQLFHIDPVTGELSVLKVLDYEALTDSEATYTFTVEALDKKGTMPPGLASVTVRIMVSVWVHVFVCISFQLLGYKDKKHILDRFVKF